MTVEPTSPLVLVYNAVHIGNAISSCALRGECVRAAMGSMYSPVSELDVTSGNMSAMRVQLLSFQRSLDCERWFTLTLQIIRVVFL